MMNLELESRPGRLPTMGELRYQFDNLQLTVRSARSDTGSETNKCFANMEERLRAIELRIQTLHADTLRFILHSSAVLVGAFGVMLGLFYIFTNRLGK